MLFYLLITVATVSKNLLSLSSLHRYLITENHFAFGASVLEYPLQALGEKTPF